MNSTAQNARNLARHLDRSSRAMAKALATGEIPTRSSWLTGPLRAALTGPLAPWLAPELVDRLESAHGRLESWKRDPGGPEFLPLSAELKRLRDELEIIAADHSTVVELVHDLLELQADDTSETEEFARAWFRAAKKLRAALPAEFAWSRGAPLLPRMTAEVYRASQANQYRDQRVSSVFATLKAWGYLLGRSSS